MGKKRTQCNRNFKDNAAKLSDERKNISELARELGIPSNLIYRW